MKTIITYFEPFNQRCTNASKEVGESLDYESYELPVCWNLVENKIIDILKKSPDVLILLGEAGSYEKVTVETCAHNIAFGMDNMKIQKNNEIIDSLSDDILYTNVLFDDSFNKSIDAGKYLCNYTYFMALKHNQNTKVVFVHIPYIIDSNRESILKEVQRIINYVILFK